MAKGKTLQAIVEIAGTLSPTLASSIEGVTDKLGGINVKALAVGAAVGGIAVATTKAVAEAGKALYDLGTQFQDAENTIRIGTGATGDDLDALMDSFDAVYGSVPTTMEEASQAIADYNTRLGLTGPELEEISKQALQVSDMLGDDLGGVIEESSQAFEAWNIDAENMSDAMDYVFKASQSTGVGFTDLMSTVQQFAPQLQEMGYSFEEATALVGQLDKAGVNTSEVLGAMKKSVSALAKEGISASDGLEQYAEQIKNAGDMTEATTIAAEIFGTKAASTMASAIRDGSISVDELTASLEANGETIAGAAEDTYTLAERFQIFKQRAQVALEPLANTLLDSLNDLMPIVSDAMEQLIPVIEELAQAIIPIIKDLVPQIAPLISQLVPPIISMAGTLATDLIPPIVDMVTSIIPVAIQLLQMLMPIVQMIIQNILPVIVKLVQQLLPVVMQIITAVLPVITQLLETLLPLLAEIIDAILPVVINLINTLLPIVMQIIDAVLPIFVQLLNLILPLITQLIEAILPVVVEILNALTPILDTIIGLLGPILELIISVVEPIITMISTAIQPLINIILTLIMQALEPLQPIINALAQLFTGVLGAALKAIQPIIAAVQDIFQGLITFITGVFAGNWSQAWSGVVTTLGGIFEGIVAVVKAPINAVIGLINSAISGLNSISVDIPDWVPVVGGKHFGINIPSIPMLATGGFTEGITIAGEAGQEAVISFDKRYHDANVGYWEQAGRMLGVLDANSIELESYSNNTSALAGQLLSVDDFSLSDMAAENQTIIYDFSGMTYAPSVTTSGGDEDDLMAKLKEHKDDFFDWLEEWLHRREVTAYA